MKLFTLALLMVSIQSTSLVIPTEVETSKCHTEIDQVKDAITKTIKDIAQLNMNVISSDF